MSTPIKDDQIAELVGTLQQKSNDYFQKMAEAIRDGASPEDAYQEVMMSLMRLFSDHIPMEEYGGLTWQEHHDQIYARADAIINDDSGRYTDDTQDAVGYVKEQMHMPGNETDFESSDLVRTIERAEAGEELDADKLEGSNAGRRPKRRTLASSGDDQRDELIRRAQTLIDDPSQKIGITFHLEEFRDAENWTDLASLVEAWKPMKSARSTSSSLRTTSAHFQRLI